MTKAEMAKKVINDSGGIAKTSEFLAAGLYAALKLSFVNIICTAIPLFYPKVIYPAKAIFSKKEG